MAKGKAGGSKNNIQNRGKVAKFFFNSKEVEAVKYAGSSTYMAMADKATGDMICDAQGKPLPWSHAQQQA